MKKLHLMMLVAGGLVLGIAVAEYWSSYTKPGPEPEARTSSSRRVQPTSELSMTPASAYIPDNPNERSFERPVDELFERDPENAEPVQQVDHAMARAEAKKRWEEEGPAQDRDVARSLKRQAKQIQMFTRMARQEQVDDEDNLLDLEGVAELQATGAVVH